MVARAAGNLQRRKTIRSHVAVAAYGSSFRGGRSRGSLCATRGPQGHLLSPLWTASDTYSPPSFLLSHLPSSSTAATAAAASPLTPLLCPRDESSRLGRASRAKGGMSRTRWRAETPGVRGAGRKGLASCGVGARGGKGRCAKERGEEPRREATGSRESSYGTEGYMAVYYVLGIRVIYASVPSCISERAGVRFLVCVCVAVIQCVSRTKRARARERSCPGTVHEGVCEQRLTSHASLSNQLASKMRRTWNHATRVKNDPAILKGEGEGRGWRCAARDGIMAHRMDERAQEWRFERCLWVE